MRVGAMPLWGKLVLGYLVACLIGSCSFMGSMIEDSHVPGGAVLLLPFLSVVMPFQVLRLILAGEELAPAVATFAKVFGFVLIVAWTLTLIYALRRRSATGPGGG